MNFDYHVNVELSVNGFGVKRNSFGFMHGYVLCPVFLDLLNVNCGTVFLD